MEIIAYCYEKILSIKYCLLITSQIKMKKLLKRYIFLSHIVKLFTNCMAVEIILNFFKAILKIIAFVKLFNKIIRLDARFYRLNLRT
jgi:hypothetical protein